MKLRLCIISSLSSTIRLHRTIHCTSTQCDRSAMTMSTQPAQPNPPSPTHQSEKTVSATADDAHSHNTSIAEKSPNHEQSNPSKAAGDDEYPGSKQVAIGMTAIFLATFLISLVSILRPSLQRPMLTRASCLSGSYHRFDGDSEHHRRVQQLRRYRMVSPDRVFRRAINT